MTTLTLVRHGQASFGTSHYDRLSELGIRQSKALGEYWARLRPQFDAVHSGDMSRQQDTARHVLDALGSDQKIVIDPALNEYNFEAILRSYIPIAAAEHPELGVQQKGALQNPKLFQAAFDKAIGYWLQDRPHTQATFESWKSFSERVLSGLRAMATSEREHVVAFTSGGVIAVALRDALGLNDAMTFRMNWRIHNGSVHRFRMGRDGLALSTFNNIAHLELTGDASMITYR